MSNIDRLSALPDSIIAHILSRLRWPDESAMTAVLSRRWQHLWTQSPNFYFRQGNLTVPDFVARVNRTLLIRNRPNQLQLLAVEFAYSKPFASDVNAWAQFAVNNKVKRVAFLLNTTASDHFHVLPQSMCSNSSLVSLAIEGCTFAPHRTIDWPCLTKLYIQGVEVPQQLIAKILSGCPLLSDLTLNECWGFTCLEIKSKTLVDIRIMDRDEDVEGGIINGPLLEISAPYVKSLTVSLSCREPRNLNLSNIPSQVILTIEFFGVDEESLEVEIKAKELLESIHHVEEVELGVNFLEVLSCMAINYGYDLISPSTSRTSLTVNTHRDELGDIHGILGLLETSPNLQKLVIQGHDNESRLEPCNYNWTPENGDQLSDLLQLKTAVIRNFILPNHVGEPMLTLVRILLKRTPVLEKIVIYGKEIFKSSPALDPFTILETLLGYPRSSQKASILLR